MKTGATVARATKQETVTITDVVAVVTDKALLLERSRRPLAISERQPWIPKSLIIECDTEIDEIVRGEEITVELPLWLVEQKGIVE